MNEFINIIWNNKEWIFSGLGIAVIASIIAIIRWFINRKYKINITYSFRYAFVQVGNNLGPNIPLLSAFILNKGSKQNYINEPLIYTSKKINGNNEFQVINMNKSTESQIPLNPGQQYTRDFEISSLSKNILIHLNKNDEIKIFTRDFRKKKFYSKGIKVSLLEQYK